MEAIDNFYKLLMHCHHSAFAKPHAGLMPDAQNAAMTRLFLLGFTLLHGIAIAQADDMQPIRGFAIDTTEVSIEQFARYAQATGIITTAEKAGGGSTYEGGWVQRKGWIWRTPFGLPASSKEPAVHISFLEAKAYCQWAGKRLPTDAEWMEAAYTERRTQPPAGFATGQTYPYPTGSSPQGANCLGDCGTVTTPSAYANPAITSRGRGHALTGSTRAGVNGLFDMGGNTWEWTDGGNDAARPTRGGSWWYGAAQMHRDHLQSKPADTAVVYIGFRCARSL
jgi:formylglycine-generating enzyme